jgi:hypothetical protein
MSVREGGAVRAGAPSHRQRWGRGRGAPVRAEAAPSRHVFPAAEHELGLAELGPHRIASDGARTGPPRFAQRRLPGDTSFR